uniref:Uncharacterized protein n=1 Tax=Cacopsylla melanoneura TaxID=428564 RepID=A0A8D8ZMS6_9HEMI
MAIIKLYHDSSNLFSLSETSSSFLNRILTEPSHGTIDFPDETNNQPQPFSVKTEALAPISDNNTRHHSFDEKNYNRLSEHSRDPGCTCRVHSICELENQPSLLDDLLEKSVEGRAIAKKAVLDEKSRKVLIHLVSEEIVGPNPSSDSIPSNIYEKWCNLILFKWKEERPESYFIQSYGTRVKPAGALYNKVGNLRTKLKSLNVYTPRTKKSGHAS